MNDSLKAAYDLLENGELGNQPSFMPIEALLLDMHKRLKVIEARFPAQQDYINPRLQSLLQSEGDE